MANDSKPVWAHCNDCGNKTKHDIRGEFYRSTGGTAPSDADEVHMAFMGPKERDDYMWSILTPSWDYNHKILQCRGCESVTYLTEIRSEDAWGPGEKELLQFPPPTARRKPNWLEKLRADHADLAELMDEIYAALQAGSRRLATMGARCVLDLLMRKEVGDRGSFERGLDALVTNNSLSQMERTILEASLDAGNAASHRSYRPNQEDMARIVGTVEHLVEQFYILRPDAEELVKSTPPRPPRAAANGVVNN